MKRLLQTNPKEDKLFFTLGLVFCAFFVLLYFFAPELFREDSAGSTCYIYTHTGYYCPGCGGTRALHAFLRGDFFESLFLHPLVPVGIITGGWFLISQTLTRLSFGKFHYAMHIRPIYYFILIALFLLNFFMKNFFSPI